MLSLGDPVFSLLVGVLGILVLNNDRIGLIDRSLFLFGLTLIDHRLDNVLVGDNACNHCQTDSAGNLQCLSRTRLHDLLRGLDDLVVHDFIGIHSESPFK